MRLRSAAPRYHDRGEAASEKLLVCCNFRWFAGESVSKDRSALCEHCANVSSNDAPAIRLRAPDACISERPSKGRTLECPAHLHPDAHHGDVSKKLDAFLAWLQTRDAHQA